MVSRDNKVAIPLILGVIFAILVLPLRSLVAPLLLIAGVVLAATFAALGVLPLVPSVQTGVIVAAGVLLDTFLVRSLLVPALAVHIGPRTWQAPERVAEGAAVGHVRDTAPTDVISDSRYNASVCSCRLNVVASNWDRLGVV